jgi:KaiC/GvpD/RAD55 family RecA-like ATPase
MHKIDEGHKALEGLSRTFGQLDLADASESQTRFHVIDQMLGDVLGWEKGDITVEDRVSEDGKTTYADYTLATVTVKLLIEAKKAGAAFSLPTRRSILKLGGVLSEGAIGEAIRQARDYCRKLSIPFAVVTNGNSWIVFPAVRTDGIPFEEGSAHVFRDLDDIRERIVEFWELLSRERVLDGNLQTILLGERTGNALTHSLRELLPEPGYRLGRNAVYDHIEPAIAAALSDEALLQSPEALEACYIKTSERLKYDTRLRMFLTDPLPPLGHPTTRVRSRKGVEEIDKHVANSVVRPPRLVLLLGPVGAGKTTFLEYTRTVSAADVIGSKVLWLYVDYKKATPEDNPRDFLLREIRSLIEADTEFGLGEWEETIKLAYREEIEKLRRGPLHLLAKNNSLEFDRYIVEFITKERNDLAPYVERIIGYSATIRPAYLVVDNVDQLDDPDFQSRIFVEAQALARRTGTNLIISLRESTYLRQRNSPVFDAFQFDSFYVDPPNVLPVLSHRFTYAKRVLAGRSAELTTERGIRVPVEDLSVFFDVVSASLLNDETGFMIEALAGGDVRRGLSLVREFLASGHTNADRALAAYLKQGNYHFPPHEVFKGAILGSMKYFNDEVALLPNLYDARLGTQNLQLLRLQLVSRLVHLASSPGFDGLSVESIWNDLSRLGVTESELRSVLQTLVLRRVLKTREGGNVLPSSSILPTRLAGYCLRVLCTIFAYNEPCCTDTVIFDDSAWNELAEITGEIESLRSPMEKMQLRIKRIETYFSYLSRTEERWVVECKRRGLDATWGQSIVGSFIVPATKKELPRVLESARKHFQANEKSEATVVVNYSDQTGIIVNTWADRDYAFIHDKNGVDWFSHKSEYTSEQDWLRRKRGAECVFCAGEQKGKPRAIRVRVPQTAS